MSLCANRPQTAAAPSEGRCSHVVMKPKQLVLVGLEQHGVFGDDEEEQEVTKRFRSSSVFILKKKKKSKNVRNATEQTVSKCCR